MPTEAEAIAAWSRRTPDAEFIRLQNAEKELVADIEAISVQRAAQVAKLTAVNAITFADIDRLTAEVAWLREDKAYLDAIENREIEIECMGTTVPYVNVYGKQGRFATTASAEKPLSLRQALAAALQPTDKEGT